jgi:sugar phosphate isomerase/epimerase
VTVLRKHGREACLSYSSNVHAAESLDELLEALRSHVAPISRKAFGDPLCFSPLSRGREPGDARAAVNLRINKRQVDELLSHAPLPSTSALSDEILSAPPSPACARFLAALDELNLDVVSINAFPISAFHGQRVKEQVYSPPWTDGGRALYSLKIAKALTHCMARPKIQRAQAAISVPSGVFKGFYGDSDEVRGQCAHFLTECARELFRLERLTGRCVRLGLEPEPATTGETVGEFIEYFKLLLTEAGQKYPQQLGVKRAQAEEILRRFITVNLDLCHQAVEFEDPLDDLKRLRAAGIGVSGLHLSAALKLSEPGRNADALAQLKAMDEPRYLHQVVAKKRDGTLARFADLPELWSPPKSGRAVDFADFAELRCHFHVPLFAELAGPLSTTRNDVAPAAQYAFREGLTDNFVVETYTWNVLQNLAQQGSTAARAVVGDSGAIDIDSGIAKELQWARQTLEA